MEEVERGIQFAAFITNKGEDVTEAGSINIEQLKQLAELDAATLKSRVMGLAEASSVKTTLSKICEMALDSALESDRDETLKTKLHRGRLIDDINKAAKDIRPLCLDSEDVTLLKERI